MSAKLKENKITKNRLKINKKKRKVPMNVGEGARRTGKSMIRRDIGIK